MPQTVNEDNVQIVHSKVFEFSHRIFVSGSVRNPLLHAHVFYIQLHACLGTADPSLHFLLTSESFLYIEIYKYRETAIGAFSSG